MDPCKVKHIVELLTQYYFNIEDQAYHIGTLQCESHIECQVLQFLQKMYTVVF